MWRERLEMRANRAARRKIAARRRDDRAAAARQERAHQQHRAAQPADQRAVGLVLRDRRGSGSSASSCRCPRPRRRDRAAAGTSPRRRRCAARCAARTPLRSAGTPRSAAARRSCCLRRPAGRAGGDRLRSRVSTWSARYSDALDSRTRTDLVQRSADWSESRRTPARARWRCRNVSTPRALIARRQARGRRCAVAPPRLTIACAWNGEMPTAPRRVPFAKPACSISHAAGIFDGVGAGRIVRHAGCRREQSSKCSRRR